MTFIRRKAKSKALDCHARLRLARNDGRAGLFFSLLLLTAFLILAEISFLIQYSGVYFGDFKLIANHLAIPLRVVPEIVLFIFIQLAVHFIFALLVWIIAISADIVLRFSGKRIEILGIVLWFIALFSILLANRILFVNSKFSFSILHMEVAKILLVILSVFWIPVVLIAFWGVGLWITQKIRNRAIVLAVIFAMLTSIFIYREINSHLPPTMDAGTTSKPNIIIIGIDSLRPDFLESQQTPHLDAFLNHATVFAESLTPIARTYPSWVSILTGIYPKLNTIRTNLSDQSQLDLSETLPAMLREEGYHTIFATDETRFSNIDTRYGFDKTIMPPVGFNDFLLGSINDFPLSNLLINTVVGKYIFPHSYANRAVFATYDPNAFLKSMQSTLTKSRTQPMLFIVHFCLPHYPYVWATLPVKTVTRYHYQASLKRVDQQFHDFMLMLKHNNFLQHSIVIVLSDHGEAVEMSGDRITEPDLFVAGKDKIPPHFYPPTLEKEKMNVSGGHGTDVLGVSQYHTLLAFRTFGTERNQKKTVSGIVSVMDIKPTLLEFLKLPIGRNSGNPLGEYIFGNDSQVNANEDFFVESDFSPTAIRTVHPEARTVLFQGIDYFRIDAKTGRIIVKDNMLKMILSSKQYADYYGSWVLALYPQANKTMMPILVNLKTGYWTNDLTTSFAENSPAKHMLMSMKIFFGEDIKFN